MHEAKRRAQAVWGATPAGSTHVEGAAAPGTREFFEAVLAKRRTIEMPWLFEVVPFASFKHKKVLEVGCGAGYDAYEICRAGADYLGIDITPDNPARTRAHLVHFGLEPKVLVADAEELPVRSGSADVVFSNGVLHHTPDIEKSFAEVSRVLAPGGEFWVILYHKSSIFYWLNLRLAMYWFFENRKRMSFDELLSTVETTTSGVRPLVRVYTRRSLKSLLRGAGLRVRSMVVRKLERRDFPRFPQYPWVGRLWDAVPERCVEALGKRFGWYVIARAQKPRLL